MKQGKTVLEDGAGGFPPRVTVGADDRAVWVLIGPLAVCLRAVAPGESYEVSAHVCGAASPPVVDPTGHTWLTLTPSPAAEARWRRHGLVETGSAG